MRASPSTLLPTGTTPMVRTLSWRSSSPMVSSSAAPSLTPGQSTTCVCTSIPIEASRRSCARTSGARGLPSNSRRSVGSVACTETLSGLSRCSASRSQSSSSRFVSVTKLPCRNDSR